MRYSFRLAEVVGHMPDPRKRPGTIKNICEFTGLDRHQVAALLKNEVKYVPLDALSKLCAYLIERGFAKADELPGRLFGVEPEHFWELIARRRRLELCLGVRQGDAKDTLDDAWVVASDSVLLGELLNGATTLGGTADQWREGNADEVKPRPTAVRPHPESLQQTLVWSPGQASLEKCKTMAGNIYQSFDEVAGDKALVCLGSNKSNPVVEAMVASCFACEPFVSQDTIPSANKRSCPILLRYRDSDPQFPSCFGGVRLAKNQAANKPGIYYEKPDGGWTCCEWAENKQDAAFVIYFHRESQGRLEMVLGGFSGLATRLLARLLARRGDEFWPPVYSDEGLQIGAFVVKFTLHGQPVEERGLGRVEPHAEDQIIKIDKEVIARRMQQLEAGGIATTDMAEPMDVVKQLAHVEELARTGQLGAAEAAAKALVQIAPGNSQAWYLLGLVYLAGGGYADAEGAFRKAVVLAPQIGDYWNTLSVALAAQNKIAEAETCSRQAVQLDSSDGTFWLNFGNALTRGERWVDAAAAYEQSLTCDPNNAQVWNNYGAAQHKLGNWTKAQNAYNRSLTLAPGALNTEINRAQLLADRGQYQLSIDLLRAIVAQQPGSSPAWSALGYALERAGNWRESEAAYHRVLELAPQHYPSLFHLGMVLFHQWSLAAAEARVREGLNACPSHADGWTLLGTIQQLRLSIDEGVTSMRRAVELSPDWQRHGRLLLGMQYANEITAEQLFRAHGEWNATYAQPLFPAAPSAALNMNRPLRLGFVSADFGRHPAAFMVLPVLEKLDKTKCSLVCYSDRIASDSYTVRFQAAADVWRATRGLTAEELAAQVRQDEVDVLFDLQGHVGLRLLAFAGKPAPVQITWFGYVGTTGLEAMDYLLADRFHVQDGEEPWYVEKVLRMPNGYACYGPPLDAPDVGSLPALTSGSVTFGSFNNPTKYSPRILDAWAAILQRVPTSTLLLKFHGLDDVQTQDRLRGHFAASGIEPTRIMIESTAPHRELLAAYDRVDIALDAQPYSGGVTTCEALWMGVPTVTFPGKTFAGRHATSYTTNAEYPQFVARDIGGYIELAVEWANRLGELAAIRATMREQVRQSLLCDAPRFARDFLKVIEHGWQLKCTGR